MEKYSDSELWLLCISGVPDAFEELYKRHYALLYNYGCKLLPSRDIVQDVIHELFLKLISNHASLSPTLSPKGYLVKALRNKIYDALDKKNSSLPFNPAVDVHESSEDPDDYPEEQIKVMLEAYGILSGRQKEVIYLYYIRGLSHEEIADILNINYQSSKNLLHRSLVYLKKEYYKKMTQE